MRGKQEHWDKTSGWRTKVWVYNNLSFYFSLTFVLDPLLAWFSKKGFIRFIFQLMYSFQFFVLFILFLSFFYFIYCIPLPNFCIKSCQDGENIFLYVWSIFHYTAVIIIIIINMVKPHIYRLSLKTVSTSF